MKTVKIFATHHKISAGRVARGGGAVCPAVPVPGYRCPRGPAVRPQPRRHPAAGGAPAVL